MAAAPPDGWLTVGHLRRPHGLRGDIFLQLITDRDDRAAPGTELFGAGRIFTIESSRRAGNGRIIAKLEDPPTDLVRRDSKFKKLELTDADVETEDQIVDVLVRHKQLLQRPVVVTDDTAIIGRPKGRVTELLS